MQSSETRSSPDSSVKQASNDIARSTVWVPPTDSDAMVTPPQYCRRVGDVAAGHRCQSSYSEKWLRATQMWVSYAFCGFRIRIVVNWPHVDVDDCDDDAQGPAGVVSTGK
ncbi:hypothetical protein MOX01_27800 [Microbacterium oxydans]|nr:hypothetical protein MOX01_27800 [Microbacterium oxydans]